MLGRSHIIRKDINNNRERIMKNLLIISFLFPPVGCVGVFRITKFTKYLRCFNWNPIVLTIKENLTNCSNDYGFLLDLPNDLKIFRVGITNLIPFNAKDKKSIPNFIYSAHKIASKNKLTAVLVTGPSFYPSLAGLYLKKRFNIPLIIDMRDSWFLWDYTKPQTAAEHFDKFLQSIIEPFVINSADKIVCASPYTKQDYLNYYHSKRLNDKFEYIPNGFDPDDYTTLTPKKFNKYTIIYSGKLFGARKTSEFLRAFKIFIEKNNLSSRCIQFIHIGRKEEDFIKEISEMELTDYFQFTGYLPYKECLSYCKGANLLIIFTTGSKKEPTTKIFDYIGCNQPILAIGNEKGILAQYIKEFNSELIQLKEDNFEKILTSLNFFYGRSLSLNNNFSYNSEIGKNYYRFNLTKRLADLLDNL